MVDYIKCFYGRLIKILMKTKGRKNECSFMKEDISSSYKMNEEDHYTPDVVVAECLPVTRKTLSHIVQGLPCFALDVASCVFEINTS